MAGLSDRPAVPAASMVFRRRRHHRHPGRRAAARGTDRRSRPGRLARVVVAVRGQPPRGWRSRARPRCRRAHWPGWSPACKPERPGIALRQPWKPSRALSPVSVTIVDDRGAQLLALTERGVSGEVLGTEMLVHLRVDPVPGPEAGWVELQGHDGTAARLFPSPRAAARAAQPRPAQVTAATWTVIAGATLRADGPRLHRGIGVTLPEVDGVSIHLDTLVSRPSGWHLYLHSSRPRVRGRDGQRKKGLIAVYAEDDRGLQVPGQLRQEHQCPRERGGRRGTRREPRRAHSPVHTSSGPARLEPQADIPGSTRGDTGRPCDRPNLTQDGSTRARKARQRVSLS